MFRPTKEYSSMTSIYDRFTMLALVCLIATAVAGCGSGSESADAPAAEKPGTSTAAQPAGEQAEVPDPGQLPSDFPADIPIYPGARTEQSYAAPAGTQFVVLNTPDSGEAVHAFYVEQLENHGWKVFSDAADKRKVVGTKDKRVVDVMIMAVRDRTDIGLSLHGALHGG